MSLMISETMSANIEGIVQRAVFICDQFPLQFLGVSTIKRKG
jgi:hypothetical protein